jgi:hypothetical protein
VTNDEARKYFADAGLSYSDITSGDICSLVMLLNKHIKAACKQGITTIKGMCTNQKITSKYWTNGTIVHCYITMRGEYFSNRECISFNPDGFIGFAGWADTKNTDPIIAAFCEWVDGVKEARHD